MSSAFSASNHAGGLVSSDALSHASLPVEEAHANQFAGSDKLAPQGVCLLTQYPDNTYDPRKPQCTRAMYSLLRPSFNRLELLASMFTETDLFSFVLERLGMLPADTSADWQEQQFVDYFAHLHFEESIEIKAAWIHLMHNQGIPVSFTELANICASIFASAPNELGFQRGRHHIHQPSDKLQKWIDLPRAFERCTTGVSNGSEMRKFSSSPTPSTANPNSSHSPRMLWSRPQSAVLLRLQISVSNDVVGYAEPPCLTLNWHLTAAETVNLESRRPVTR